MPNDLRYSLRYIRKHAVESAAVVLSFALGIGASASVLSTVDSLLFRPPPRVLNPESVKRIYFRRLGATVEQTGSATSYPLYLEFARRSHSLTASQRWGILVSCDQSHTVTSRFWVFVQPLDTSLELKTIEPGLSRRQLCRMTSGAAGWQAIRASWGER